MDREDIEMRSFDRMLINSRHASYQGFQRRWNCFMSQEMRIQSIW